MFPLYPSAAAMIQANFACQSFVPNSMSNANLSEFCDPRLDAQIYNALAAESNNSPDTAALWAQGDRTATDQAPVVPLTTPTNIDFVGARVGNYQYSAAGLPVLLGINLGCAEQRLRRERNNSTVEACRHRPR